MKKIFSLFNQNNLCKKHYCIDGGCFRYHFQDYNKEYLPLLLLKNHCCCKKQTNSYCRRSKKDNFWAYQGVDLFKPNLKELNDACGTQIVGDNITSIKKETKKLQKNLS